MLKQISENFAAHILLSPFRDVAVCQTLQCKSYTTCISMEWHPCNIGSSGTTTMGRCLLVRFCTDNLCSLAQQPFRDFQFRTSWLPNFPSNASIYKSNGERRWPCIDDWQLRCCWLTEMYFSHAAVLLQSELARGDALLLSLR